MDYHAKLTRQTSELGVWTLGFTQNLCPNSNVQRGGGGGLMVFWFRIILGLVLENIKSPIDVVAELSTSNLSTFSARPLALSTIFVSLLPLRAQEKKKAV